MLCYSYVYWYCYVFIWCVFGFFNGLVRDLGIGVGGGDFFIFLFYIMLCLFVVEFYIDIFLDKKSGVVGCGIFGWDGCLFMIVLFWFCFVVWVVVIIVDDCWG